MVEGANNCIFQYDIYTLDSNAKIEIPGLRHRIIQAGIYRKCKISGCQSTIQRGAAMFVRGDDQQKPQRTISAA